MAGQALREVLALFSLDLDDKGLKEGERELQGLVGRVRKVGELVAEAFAVHEIKEFFEAQVEGAAHVQDLAERLDVTATTIRRFGFAAQGAGLDLDAAATSLGFLQRNLGEARIKGGEAAQGFAKLHVALKDAHGQARPLDDVILDVADGLAKLPDQQQRAAVTMQIFGREGRAILPVLAKGSKAIRDMFAEADELSDGLGDKFYEDAKRAREEGEKFGFALQSVKNRILSAALPTLMKLLGGLKDFTKRVIEADKKYNILGDTMAFIAGFAGVKLLSTFGKILRILGLLKPSIGETILSLLRWALPLALVAGFVLIVQDLWTLFRGGKSVIGQLLDKMFGFGTAKKFVDELRAAWDGAKGTLEALLPNLEDAAKWVAKAFIESLPSLIAFAGVLATDIVGAFDEVASYARIATNAIASFFTKDQATKNQLAKESLEISDALDARAKARGQLIEGINKAYNAAPNSAFVAGTGAGGEEVVSAPIVRRGGGAAGASGTVIHQGDINVEVHTQPGADAKAIGQATGQGVATAQQKANNAAYTAARKP